MNKIIIALSVLVLSFSRSYADFMPNVYLHCTIQTDSTKFTGYLLFNLSPQQLIDTNLEDNKSILNALHESKDSFKVYNYLDKIVLPHESSEYEFIYVSYKNYLQIESSSIKGFILNEVIYNNGPNAGAGITSELQPNNRFWLNNEILESFTIPEVAGSSGRINVYSYLTNSNLTSFVEEIIDLTNRHNSNFRKFGETELSELRRKRRELVEKIRTVNNTLVLEFGYD